MRPSIDCCCAIAVDPAPGRLPAGQRIFARNRQPGIALDQFGTEDETAASPFVGSSWRWSQPRASAAFTLLGTVDQPSI